MDEELTRHLKDDVEPTNYMAGNRGMWPGVVGFNVWGSEVPGYENVGSVTFCVDCGVESDDTPLDESHINCDSEDMPVSCHTILRHQHSGPSTIKPGTRCIECGHAVAVDEVKTVVGELKEELRV